MIPTLKSNIYSSRFQFWAIIATVCFLSLLSAFENTVVATSLPYIAAQLHLENDYPWVTNVFFLAAAAVQPVFGQLANVFGRRRVTMAIVLFFSLGSGVCGFATNGATLIVGRALQGIGGGGINTISHVIVSDLVPLRERGNYIALFLTTYFIGTAVGPWIGGAIIETTSWRWAFHINLPVGGVAMVMIFFFLHIGYDKKMCLSQKLRRIDYIGNVLLMGSAIATLYALSYGGTAQPWSSPRIVAPLVFGLVGLGAFILFEATAMAKEPMVPPRLFTDRASAVNLVLTFSSSALLFWVMYFLPVYFQAVKGSSPAHAGVQYLPSIVVVVPVAIASVLVLSRVGRYKPIHFVGFATSTIGFGFFTLLDKESTTIEWVLFQVVTGTGAGILLDTLLPACQATQTEADQASTTAAWNSVRSFGAIWGVMIPAAILNNHFENMAWSITDPNVREVFKNGKAYQHATAEVLNTFSSVTKAEIIGLFSDCLKQIWQIAMGLSIFSCILVFFQREIRLRTDLETEYGLVNRPNHSEQPRARWHSESS